MLRVCVRSTDFFSPPPLISSGEGGSSDAAVNLLGCVRVQLSEGRRKPGIKTKEVLKGQGERTESVSEADLRRVYRGQTDRRDMEATTEEEYKEKLLWNVKREVGAAVERPVEIHIYIFHCIIFCKLIIYLNHYNALVSV